MVSRGNDLGKLRVLTNDRRWRSPKAIAAAILETTSLPVAMRTNTTMMPRLRIAGSSNFVKPLMTRQRATFASSLEVPPFGGPPGTAAFEHTVIHLMKRQLSSNKQVYDPQVGQYANDSTVQVRTVSKAVPANEMESDVMMQFTEPATFPIQ
jgi:hypothetical protein